MRLTSLQAYNKIRNNGLLSKARFKVYECLSLNGPSTASEVLNKLSLPSNQSGRFTELNYLGVIAEKKTRKCKITGNTAIEWEVTNNLPIGKVKKPKSLSTRFSDPQFIENVCLSYRHDFFLLSKEQQERIIFECKNWMRAIKNNESTST